MAGYWTVFGDSMEPYGDGLTTEEARELLQALAEGDPDMNFYAEDATGGTMEPGE